MIRFCSRDDRQLKVLGTTTFECIDKVVVRRCPGCGKITLWDDYDEIKNETQKTLKAML